MNSAAAISKRIDNLELIGKKPGDPSIVFCAPSEYESLRKKYPKAVFFIDDIEFKEVPLS